MKVGKELDDSGENVFVGGKNRWKYVFFFFNILIHCRYQRFFNYQCYEQIFNICELGVVVAKLSSSGLF